MINLELQEYLIKPVTVIIIHVYMWLVLNLIPHPRNPAKSP